MSKRTKFYRPAWGVNTGGIWSELPEMRRILTKLGVEWFEISRARTGKDDDVVMVFMTDEEVRKLPIDSEAIDKNTGLPATGLNVHYLPTHEDEDGEYSGHTIYEVTLFQLQSLLPTKLAKNYNNPIDKKKNR